MRQPIPLADLSEKEWQAQLIDVAVTCGWERNAIYHPYDSRRSTPGWPDLSLLRERLCFVECKGETGRLSDYQKYWLRKLLMAGQEVYVMRPSDLEVAATIFRYRWPLDRSDAAGDQARRLLKKTREAIAF